MEETSLEVQLICDETEHIDIHGFKSGWTGQHGRSRRREDKLTVTSEANGPTPAILDVQEVVHALDVSAVGILQVRDGSEPWAGSGDLRHRDPRGRRERGWQSMP